DLLIEFPRMLEDMFQRQTDAARCSAATDQKCARYFSTRGLPNELLDLPPRRDPLSPGDPRKYDCRPDNRAKQKPKHAGLIFPQPVTKTARGFDRIAGFPKFLPEAA